MSDNMSDGANAGLIGVILLALGSIGTFIKFWTTFSDRITRSKARADAAMKEATEAKAENRKLREAQDAMALELHNHFENMRREAGETAAAIRQHVTELAFFVRDSFARKDELAAAITEMKGVQLRMAEKLDDISEQIRNSN